MTGTKILSCLQPYLFMDSLYPHCLYVNIVLCCTWPFSFPSVYLHPLTFSRKTIITYLCFHFVTLHVSSLFWLLLCRRSNSSLIIPIYVLMSIFFSFEHGHPEIYTTFKKRVYLDSHLPFHEEKGVEGTSQDTLRGIFCKCISCLQVINVINYYTNIFLLLCYFQLMNYKVIEILHTSTLKALLSFL